MKDTNNYIGIETRSENAGTKRYGMIARATSAPTNNFALWAKATGGSGVNYGIYAIASGAKTNHAGYFAGSIVCTAGCGQASDEKFKEGITDLDGAEVMEKVMRLRPTTYSFKTGGEFESFRFKRGTQYGLIAQEVEAVFPEIVSEAVHPAELDEEGKEVGNPVNYKSMDYSALVPLLLKAIQEQQTSIQEQQAEIDALKSALQSNGILVDR